MEFNDRSVKTTEYSSNPSGSRCGRSDGMGLSLHDFGALGQHSTTGRADKNFGV
jgi:hypothetical protein